MWSEGFPGFSSITWIETATVLFDEYLLDIVFDIELSPT